MNFDRDAQGDIGYTGSTSDQGLGGTSRESGYNAGTPNADPDGNGNGAWDDAGTRAGSFDRKFAGEDELGPEGVRERVSEGIEQGRERIHEALDNNRDRIQNAVEGGKTRVASQLERLGETLEQRARTMEQAGGVQRRAGQVALRASSALDTGAEYIRTHEPQEMRDDLEEAIRQRPLLSVGVAIGAGFLLARLMRD